MKIIPAIIAKDQKELDARLGKVIRYSDIFHLDVMDGVFVGNVSLDFMISLPKARYEAHLMLRNPAPWMYDNMSRVERMIFHIETRSVSQLIMDAKNSGRKVGLAVNPETETSEVEPFLDDVDRVLVMTVNPGKYGAPFLPAMLRKISRLKALYPRIEIEADGGVNPETIARLKAAGASVFACGSYLQGSDPKKAIAELEALIQ